MVVAETSGARKRVTGNECYLLAMIDAIKKTEDGSLIHIMTDSNYASLVLSNTKKKFSKNGDVIKKFRSLVGKRSVHFLYVNLDNDWLRACNQMCLDQINATYNELNGLSDSNLYLSEYL